MGSRRVYTAEQLSAHRQKTCYLKKNELTIKSRRKFKNINDNKNTAI